MSTTPHPATLPRNAAEVAVFARQAYEHQAGLRGIFTRLRPYICPFDELLPQVPRGASVLDVGCGVGLLSALVTHFAAPRRVLGIDVSPEAIAVARDCRCDHKNVLQFEVRPPGQFPSEEFDVVLCVDVLHHVPPSQQREFVQALLRRVAPGGLLLFKDISPRPWWKALANRMHDLVLARQWAHHRHESVVAEWLADPTGRVAVCRRVDRLWYSHYLIRWQRTPAPVIHKTPQPQAFRVPRTVSNRT